MGKRKGRRWNVYIISRRSNYNGILELKSVKRERSCELFPKLGISQHVI